MPPASTLIPPVFLTVKAWSNGCARERASGRRIILATGTPRKFADAIATHLGMFDAVHATDGLHNFTSKKKCAALVEAYGDGGFDYAGNSRHDLACFDVAREAIVVAPDRYAARWQSAHKAELFETPKPTFKTYLKMLRAHQWAKNVLIAVPNSRKSSSRYETTSQDSSRACSRRSLSRPSCRMCQRSIAR